MWTEQITIITFKFYSDVSNVCQNMPDFKQVINSRYTLIIYNI